MILQHPDVGVPPPPTRKLSSSIYLSKASSVHTILSFVGASFFRALFVIIVHPFFRISFIIWLFSFKSSQQLYRFGCFKHIYTRSCLYCSDTRVFHVSAITSAKQNHRSSPQLLRWVLSVHDRNKLSHEKNRPRKSQKSNIILSLYLSIYHCFSIVPLCRKTALFQLALFFVDIDL